MSRPAGKYARAIIDSLGRLLTERLQAKVALGAGRQTVQKEWVEKPSGRRYKVTDDQIMHVKELRAQGLSQDKIAKAVGVCRSTVLQILQGKRRYDVRPD